MNINKLIRKIKDTKPTQQKLNDSIKLLEIIKQETKRKKKIIGELINIIQKEIKTDIKRISYNKKKDITFYFSPYCGHCHTFMPLWKSMKNKFEYFYNFKEINCSNNDKCQTKNIRSVPTIIIDDKEFTDERNKKNFILYLMDNIN